jgi:PhzF family phenazine biosynthesis protein
VDDVRVVRVFADGAGGGNPVPIVLEADGWSDEAMREVARSSGHESGFVLSPPPGSPAGFRFRFWVPEHEMEMCVIGGPARTMTRLDRDLPDVERRPTEGYARVETTPRPC